MDCGNDGSGTLSSCQSNPNIMIEKITKGNKIKSYKLSLILRILGGHQMINGLNVKICAKLANHYQEKPNAVRVYTCSYICVSSQAIILFYDHIGCGNLCEEKVDRFLNNFCANATPTTLTSTVTDTQTTTSTSIKTETVTSVSPTTVTRYSTIRNVQKTVIVSTIATTTMENRCLPLCPPE